MLRSARAEVLMLSQLAPLPSRTTRTRVTIAAVHWPATSLGRVVTAASAEQHHRAAEELAIPCRATNIVELEIYKRGVVANADVTLVVGGRAHY